MPKKNYILKVERKVPVRGKDSVAFFSGNENGSMQYTTKIEKAQVFHTKKDAQYWLRFTGGEIIEPDGKKKVKSRMKVVR
jgi:hypothetical protein